MRKSELQESVGAFKPVGQAVLALPSDAGAAVHEGDFGFDRTAAESAAAERRSATGSRAKSPSTEAAAPSSTPEPSLGR